MEGECWELLSESNRKSLTDVAWWAEYFLSMYKRPWVQSPALKKKKKGKNVTTTEKSLFCKGFCFVLFLTRDFEQRDNDI